MKENVQYKNEALASLKGNWAQAVLGILILLLISYALVTPMYAMMLKDPTDLEAITAAQNRSMPLIWILGIFFINPLQLYLSTITWMYNSDVDMNIADKARTYDSLNINSSGEASGLIALFVGFPALVALAGVVIWLRRKDG